MVLDRRPAGMLGLVRNQPYQMYHSVIPDPRTSRTEYEPAAFSTWPSRTRPRVIVSGLANTSSNFGP